MPRDFWTFYFQTPETTITNKKICLLSWEFGIENVPEVVKTEDPGLTHFDELKSIT